MIDFNGNVLRCYSDRFQKVFFIVMDDEDKELSYPDEIVYTMPELIEILDLKYVFPKMKVIDIFKKKFEIGTSKMSSATIPPPPSPSPSRQGSMF